MPSTIDERIIEQPSKTEVQLGWVRAFQAAGARAAKDEDSRATTDSVSPERLKLAVKLSKAGIRYLSAILQDLVEIGSGPESDEFGTLHPTTRAFDDSSELLVNAAILAGVEGRQIPLGCVSTDSQGGVRIEWVRDRASVHLVVPASLDTAAYIYHEVGNEYATEDVTPEGLARWLREIY